MSSSHSWRFSSALLLLALSTLFLGGCTFWRTPQIGGLEVRMEGDTAAQVFLDDLHLGQAPITKNDVRPGTFTLKLVPDSPDKQPYETQIHVYAGAYTSVIWSFSGKELVGSGDILELEPLASHDRAELSTITVPEGASIRLNTTAYGLSPVILDDVPVGSHTLVIHAVGHLQKSLPVEIQPGFRLRVFSRLEKEDTATSAATPSPQPTPSNSSPPILTATNAPTSPKPSSSPKPKLSPPYVTIKDTGTGWLRVRGEANATAPEVGRVDVGAEYPYKSTINGWFEIEYETGKTGWITGQYATLTRE